MDDLRSEGSGNSVVGSHNSLLYLSLYDSLSITILEKKNYDWTLAVHEYL